MLRPYALIFDGPTSSKIVCMSALYFMASPARPEPMTTGGWM